jgi:hypothetical protein
MAQSAVETPPDHFRLLKITGRDRVRFLHNFCTADIRGLVPGKATEAFFPDARARIVAHGYVLMFEDQIQLWLLGDDPQRLRSHLDRYIISDDVSLTVPPVTDSAVFSLVADCPSDNFTAAASGTCRILFPPDNSAAALFFAWNGRLLAGCCGDPTAVSAICSETALQPYRLAGHALQALRIAERFPIIGVDMSLEHLAPEADRNSSAISFHKGCYLGQEPIARIDALGHINRALRCVQVVAEDQPANNSKEVSAARIIGAELLSADGSVAGRITSVVPTDNAFLALSVLRLATATNITEVRTETGLRLTATVLERR